MIQSLSKTSRIVRMFRWNNKSLLFRPVLLNEYSTSKLGLQQSKFAVVNHGKSYEEQMNGRHGKQLQLAKLDGMGRDDPPFNPFLDEEDDEVDIDSEEEEEEEDDDEEDDEEDEEDENEKEFKRLYNNDGSLKWKKSEIATYRAGAPAGGMFAIIELAGSQFKVTVDDLLIVNKLKPVQKYKVGSVHTIKDNVLLIGSSHLSLVGMPYIAGAEVTFMIEEITQDKKVIIFKKRRKKHSQRKNGFRRELSFVRILQINPPQPYQHHEHVKRVEPNTEELA